MHLAASVCVCVSVSSVYARKFESLDIDFTDGMQVQLENIQVKFIYISVIEAMSQMQKIHKFNQFH